MIGAAALADALGLPPPTPEQVRVIEAPLEPTLVVAGAGSGKTETMAARVVFVVANGWASPESILGLTFTRKAAAGLAARIRSRLRGLARSGVLPEKIRAEVLSGEPEVSTYHSFGGRVIGEFGPLLGMETRSRVLTPTASWQLARRVVGRWDGELLTELRPEQVTEHLLALAGGLADHLSDTDALADAYAEVLRVIDISPPTSRQKTLLRKELVDHRRRLRDRTEILPLVEAFATAKRESEAIDYSDQMALAARLATDIPAVGAALRDRFRIVLLDEYQDTGHAQRVILRSLFGIGATTPGHPVMAVGDPVQSIYSWRGASASNLPRFVTDFPAQDGSPAPRLPLSTSWRNPSLVLDLANSISGPVREEPVPVDPLGPRPQAPQGTVRYGLFTTAEDEDRWVAAGIAERWAERTQAGLPPPTTAVLLRRRAHLEPLADELRALGLPVEVVGIGGLLSEPEVADLLAMLRVLIDPSAGDAAIRLLTGARWRLGLADLDALARRATELSRGAAVPPVATEEPVGAPGAAAAVRSALGQAVAEDEVDAHSLVDALSDPGPAERYSAAGLERIERLAAELQRLRGRLGQPLPDLLVDLERTSGLDVEVQLHSAAGRAHLDAFADIVADVAAAGAGPVELIEYLMMAEEREDGLAPGEADPVPGRVQLMTLHAAKGLEWELVAVPHLTKNVFPGTKGTTWLTDSSQLPPSVRGDREELPELRLDAGCDQKELMDALAAHTEQIKAAAAIEERRLFYVAVTRTEHDLLLSGHHWGRTTSTPAGPSEFLLEVDRFAAADDRVAKAHWADPPEPDSENPLLTESAVVSWPVDPLAGRRALVEHGAGLVAHASPVPVSGDGPDPHSWARDVEALLAERADRRRSVVQVPLPAALNVTGLAELAQDPIGLARRLRRPVPAAPSPQARRGTAFHAWLERWFHGEPLLDVAELPGAGDTGAADDQELERLREAFLSSPWASRVPLEIEAGFSVTVAGIPVRGRVDAVFADPDGGLTVVDWKTGAPPPRDRMHDAAVQLAVYRLAMAELHGLPPERVRAAFHHVAHGVTLAPGDLLDAAGLEQLVRSATTAPTPTPVPADRSAAPRRGPLPKGHPLPEDGFEPPPDDLEPPPDDEFGPPPEDGFEPPPEEEFGAPSGDGFEPPPDDAEPSPPDTGQAGLFGDPDMARSTSC
ncbi:AAA family ATPase [Nakamurella sp. YIM 132087]|uniref:DNA 3'-5' helicase n=1 Tax=Nakamurella alba TaxID=2665158 RepID=A0A7K1FHT8_9ACTN|nr:ATP-dependent DNA helicase [Nakamurella alba]MTD13668.1 AAA family ATPase [Nakamurella alba]